MANLESKKQTVKAQFKQRDLWLRQEWVPALREAAKFFETDVHDGWLVWALAQIVFGKTGRGRQVKDWHPIKMIDLAQLYFSHYEKMGLTDSNIAKLIAKDAPARFGGDAEQIRKVLPRAKRLFPIKWPP
jgi:hypothetical protein